MSGQVFVLDRADTIVRVDDQGAAGVAPFLGHPVWTLLPEAGPVLGPVLEEAREAGGVVESTIFYAGASVDVRIVPMGGCLAVRLERRTELDLRTLETLAASLGSIESELAAREHVRRDRRARASPQALP